MDFEGLRKDRSDTKAGIEGVVGILEDHLDLFAVRTELGTMEGADLRSFIRHGTRSRIEQSDDDPAQSGLS